MNNPFLDACGANGPLLLSTESPGVTGGETRAFDLPFVLAGRDPRSDLHLGHPDVSDRHAYFQLVDGQVLCIDLGSRLGIFQGGKCQRLGYLERERAVRIGPYRVRLVGGDRDPGAVASADAPPSPLPLELSHRSVRNSRCDLPGGLALVGSASDCQIRLVDPSVSNYHCSLVHTPGGVWVVDLLGQGGVRVNGHDVAYAQIHEGDSLQIGHSVIRWLEPTEATAQGVSILTAAPRAADSPAIETPMGSSHDDAHPPVPQTAEMVERALGPMVSQVGLLQQQMVEEIHQARAMLFDTFSTLQQEQTAFINQELDQIRQISEDLHALRADLERQTRLLTDRFLAATPSMRLGSATASVPALIAPAHVHTHVHTNANTASGRNGQTTTVPPTFSRPATENGLIRGHNEQAHAKLCVRIARLKKKQITRWERLRSFFPGMNHNTSS